MNGIPPPDPRPPGADDVAEVDDPAIGDAGRRRVRERGARLVLHKAKQPLSLAGDEYEAGSHLWPLG